MNINVLILYLTRSFVSQLVQWLDEEPPRGYADIKPLLLLFAVYWNICLQTYYKIWAPKKRKQFLLIPKKKYNPPAILYILHNSIS